MPRQGMTLREKAREKEEKIEVTRNGELISGEGFVKTQSSTIWEALIKETIKRHPEILADLT